MAFFAGGCADAAANSQGWRFWLNLVCALLAAVMAYALWAEHKRLT